MEADNENYQANDVERDSDACGHEFDHGSDHGNSHGSSSDDKNSVNGYDYDSEQRNASRYIAVLTCTTDVMPRRGLFMQTLCRSNPVFKRVRFASVQDECFKFYEDIKGYLKPLLRNLDGQISLSVDILSCRKFCEYMCLKAHFIDKDWNLMNLVLNFHRICEVGDDCIVEAILKVLKDWDIGNKIANITFLTGSVENKEIDEIKDYVQETKKLQFNGQRFCLYCCADIFNRMVQDAFEVIRMTIHTIDFLMYFGKPSSGSRWDAVYDRLKMALEREAKEEFKEEYDRDKPSADEWKKVEGICKLLESLYNAAKAVFETKDSTAVIYFQNLQEVRATLTKETNSSDSLTRDVATEMHKRFEKYWKKMFLYWQLLQ